MSDLFWFTVVISIFTLFNGVAIGGVFLSKITKRTFPDERFTSLIIQVYGIIYALFLGFITLSVWERFNGVRTEVQNEGKYIVDLYREAMVFPQFSEDKIQAELMAYIDYVLDKEWPNMPNKAFFDEGDLIVSRIWQAYYDFTPTTEKERIWYWEAIDKLVLFSNARLMRAYNSKGFVGIAIWTLLIGGGLVLVFTPCFFQMKSLFFKMILTLFLANIIAFMLFIIFSFDHPFIGYAEIDNYPFKYARKVVEPW